MDSIERRIFFLCQDTNDISGGVKKIYQHVDILNRHGHRAFVLHFHSNFRCTWFQNNTSIVYPSWPSGTKDFPFYPRGLPLHTTTEQLPPINSHDIVVVPEINALSSDVISMGILQQPFVVFSQNTYYTFNNLILPPAPFLSDKSLVPNNPYNASSLLGIIVVSEDNFEYMHFAFPSIPLYHVRLSVDHKKFAFSPFKRKQIAYMTRKSWHDIVQLVGVLLTRGNLKGWFFVPIENQTEDQVAEILKNSWIFLSSASFEGFSLPAMEAILCGCLVAGYHGQGGKEFIRPPLAVPIDNQDILGFAKAVEMIAANIDLHPQEQLKKAKQNSELIKSLYFQEQEERDVLKVWKEILSRK